MRVNITPTFTTEDWLKVRQLDDDTWAIDDHGQDICYLVCGQDRCLLIDTGWGIGDLRALVAELNPLPLTVVNTHGHPDHTFGNWQFPEVYITEADIPLVNETPSRAVRQFIAEDILPQPLPEDFDITTWTEGGRANLIPMQEGDLFDLGNRVLEILALSGHSPGSIALLDRQRRWLFSGDTILSGTIWLHLEESLPLSEFLVSMTNMQTRAKAFDAIYPAHGELQTLPLPVSLIDDIVDGLLKIIDGTLQGEPETTFAGDGYYSNLGSWGIMYNPNRM